MSFTLDQFGPAASAFSIISTACYLTGSQGVVPGITFLASTILFAKAQQPVEKYYKIGVIFLVVNLFSLAVHEIQNRRIDKIFALLINVITSVVISVFANDMLISGGNAALAFFAKEIAVQGLGGLFLKAAFTGAKIALTSTSIVAVAGLVFYGLSKYQSTLFSHQST